MSLLESFGERHRNPIGEIEMSRSGRKTKPDTEFSFGDYEFAKSSFADAAELMARALSEDPFATTHSDDCLVDLPGITPTPLHRYEHASGAFLAHVYSHEHDPEKEEVLRLIAAYWLRESKSVWQG